MNSSILGIPLWLSWQRIRLECGRCGFDSWVGKILWRRERLSTPVFWPGEFHELYSPWDCKELNTTEWLSISCTYFHFITCLLIVSVVLLCLFLHLVFTFVDGLFSFIVCLCLFLLSFCVSIGAFSCVFTMGSYMLNQNYFNLF